MSDVERAQLGWELRRMREDCGLTGVQVAAAIGWTQSKFSRVETGRFAASLSELAKLLDFYGVGEDVRAELLSRSARRDGIEGAWIVRAGGPRARHTSLVAVESRAEQLSQFQAAVVPGLLQTPAYARAVAASAGFADVDEIVRRRSSRQAHYFENGPRYEVVITESVLASSAASASVMDEQLSRLVALPAGVTLRILPLEHALPVTPLVSFLMFDFGVNKPSVVLIESQTADLYVSSEPDVEAYSGLFDRLSEAAQGVEESAETIKSHRRTLRRVLRKG
ncbi:MAG: helix-turn-helix domain-containing protein [Humibacillus sp.]|nr:helix-turn-helix domain-containing protein [Humibacillus sp.]MDN5778755.1 helix-turn-helix domain-containing protein [Humibacillus sp.]